MLLEIDKIWLSDRIDCMKRHEFDNELVHLESLNNSLQFLEMPSIIKNIHKTLEQVIQKQDFIHEFLAKQKNTLDIGDRYLTPKAAMDYLGFSKGTFDKYRYKSKINITGHQLDGKTWYKKSDLDKFMLTYQAKSVGLA